MSALVKRNHQGYVPGFFDPFFFGTLAPIPRPKHFPIESKLALDVYEKDNEYVIEVDTPGLDKKDINLTFADGILQISYQLNSENVETDEDKNDNKEETTTENRTHYIHRERFVSSGYRRVYVGKDVQESAITANLENGVLTITCPKKQEEKEEKHSIEIK